MAAKAYRLLRAVLRTAVEEDKILPSNPCRVRGAGEEHPAERPVLTVVQVFELADLSGRRPVGNIRQLTGGGHRLRFQAWPSSSLGKARWSNRPVLLYSRHPNRRRSLVSGLRV